MARKNPQPALDAIRAALIEMPELRVCQIISNAMLSSGWKTNDMFYVEDDQLKEAIDAYRRIDNR